MSADAARTSFEMRPVSLDDSLEYPTSDRPLQALQRAVFSAQVSVGTVFAMPVEQEGYHYC